IKILNPDYIALSITNYYNIVVTKKLTEMIKKDYPNTKIILGGQATKNEMTLQQLQYDYVVLTHEDILRFKEDIL
ncbi:MAG: cobalamin-dependent protein, partial [Candidatus Izemoplasmatales bacterium]